MSTAAMSREECRHAILSQLDRAASHPWVIGQQALELTKAVREIVVTDDGIVDRINALMLSRRAAAEAPDTTGEEGGYPA